MKDRITVADLMKLRKIRARAEQLADDVDELERAVHDVIGASEAQREPLTEITDSVNDFLRNRGTVADLLLELEIDVDGMSGDPE